MKAHHINLDVGEYTFHFVSEVEVSSSWEDLTDVASIVTPRKLRFEDQVIVQGESLFQRGDAVSIQLGYDGELDQVFQGNLSGITPGVPLRFRCEDDMWKLKQKSHTLSYKSPTLQQILTDISPIPFDAIDAELGPIRFSNRTGAQILEELRKTYGLQSWIREGTLYAGLAYRPDQASRHTFKFEWNIIDDNLEYQREDDISFRIKAVSMMPDNSKIELELGDPEGETRTLTYIGLSESQLRDTAQREMERLRVEGYSGSFTTFGQPQVRHGDYVTLIDERYGDRNGTYLVKRVTTTGGVNGYRQEIELDI